MTKLSEAVVCGHCIARTYTLKMKKSHPGLVQAGLFIPVVLHFGLNQTLLDSTMLKVLPVLMLVATFMLTSCAPQTALHDLAGVFARWDQNDNASEYYERLIEMEQCIWRILDTEGPAEFTRQEVMVITIYSVGVFNMAAQAQGLSESTSTDRETYQNLTRAVEFCKGANANPVPSRSSYAVLPKSVS